LRRRLGLTAFLAVALPLAAQQHPNVERGFQADKVYQLNGIDNVNVYNGNLSLSIPIGTEYPGNGTLKYSFALTYNSKNWDQEEYIYEYNEVCSLPAGSDIPPPGDCGKPYVKTVPSKSSNAGMGWMLSLGRLLSPLDPALGGGSVGLGPLYWEYESPDGARHPFTLGNLTLAYTNDGSFLRKKDLGSDRFEIHFPDGMIHTFAPAAGNLHRLEQIKDPFGNHLDICYTAQCGGTDGDWMLQEYGASGTLVREHYVRFADLTTGVHPPDNGRPLNAPPNYDKVITSVDIAGFNGTRAVYSFEYTTDEIPYQTAGCYGDYRYGETPNPSVPRLKKVTLPDSEQSHWLMEYGNSGACSAITKLVLPTTGRMEWEYMPYSLPTAACRSPLVPDEGPGDAFYSTVEGVMTKKLYTDALQQTAESTWTYAQGLSLPALFPCGSGNQTPKQQQSTVSITSPDGLKAEHYFSVWNTSHDGTNPPTFFDVSEYSLPFTRGPGSGCDHAFSSTEWCLSSRIFECPSGQCASLPKRSTYVRYEGDARYSASGFEGFGYRREVATKTVFNDDGDRSVQTERSLYDGLGHFRHVVTSDSWSGFSRIEDTDYNWLKPAVTVNATDWANSPADNRPSMPDPWLLNLFRTSTISGNGSSIETGFCFNPTTGFLNWKRMVTGAAPANDVLAVFDPDVNGNVTKERYFGGDLTPLADTAIACPYTPTSDAAFTLNHTYASGVRNSSQYSGFSFKALDLTIDANTGFPSASRDTSRRETLFEYDALGRVTKISPPAAAWTQYSYGTTETPPHASAKQWNSATYPNTPLTEKHYYYDGLGRLKQSRTQMPANWSVTATTYDDAGRPAAISMPEYRSGSAYESFAPLHTSSYAYDLLGRVVQVTAPDLTHTTTSYTGSRLVTKTQAINATNTSVSTQEAYDGAGQLLAVTEDFCPTYGEGSNVLTRYEYDASGHLTCVDMSASNPCSAGLYNRSFTYDGRGFLQKESHPENGTSAYKYDALGHVTEKTVTASTSLFDLQYDYDLAGRLRHVTRKNGLKTLKELTYNDNSSSPNFGKLETSSSSNYDTPAGSTVPVTVKETYTYGDFAGRLTYKSTRISGIGSDRDVAQSYAYDDLAEVSDVTYPFTAASGGPAWSHLLPKYSYGLLTRLDANNSQPSFMPPLTDISYAPAGTANILPHKNGVTDTYTPDSNGMARPQSIGFAGWSGGCTAPAVGAIQSSNGTSLTSGQSTNLFVAVDGHGETPTYQWYLGGAAVNGATLSSYTVAPTQTSTYQVRAANSCGYADSASITITIQVNAPAAPANLVAERDATSPGNAPRINVNWQPSNGAAGYDVWRQSNGVWQKRTATPIGDTSYLDSVAADTAYVYYAIAVGTNGLSSAPSNKDAANSFVFAAVNSGQQILFADFDALLQHGINRLLTATGNPTRSWHDIDNVSGADCTISAASDPDPVNHTPILGAHMLALRCAMNRALTSAGVPLTAFIDPSLVNVFIKAVHINELQNRTR
jgi:YD repeat-containing protein